MNNSMDSLTVYFNTSIKEAMKSLDKVGIGFICVIDDNKRVIGVVTDGDLRRAILNEVKLTDDINKIANRNYKYLLEDYTEEQIKNIFENTVINHVPIIDSDGKLKNIITRESFYGKKHIKSKINIHSEVVIMAGGKGTRLDPFTRVLPKPLIPIGERTILELIIEKFTEYGINNFIISVNHKEKIIKSYFDEIRPSYCITYLSENKPLGTVGALKQLEGYSDRTIFLTNCDIIIETNYADLLNYHLEQKNLITIVASLKQYRIPYGVCEVENGGQLINIKEKPEYDLLVNTGMYLICPEVLKYIPENQYYNMTNLIDELKRDKKRIGLFPISESSWIDIGQLEEYQKVLKKISF